MVLVAVRRPEAQVQILVEVDPFCAAAQFAEARDIPPSEPTSLVKGEAACALIIRISLLLVLVHGVVLVFSLPVLRCTLRRCVVFAICQFPKP